MREIFLFHGEFRKIQRKFSVKFRNFENKKQIKKIFSITEKSRKIICKRKMINGI